MPLLNKRELKPYSTDKLKVYSVNTEFVNKNYVPDFCGGNALTMEFIPHGEIWIADDLKEDQIKRMVYFLLVQKRLLSMGMGYDDAARMARQREDKMVENKKIDQSIKDELAKTKDMIVEPSICNGTYFNTHHEKSEKHHNYVKKLSENQKKRRERFAKGKMKYPSMITETY